MSNEPQTATQVLLDKELLARIQSERMAEVHYPFIERMTRDAFIELMTYGACAVELTPEGQRLIPREEWCKLTKEGD